MDLKRENSIRDKPSVDYAKMVQGNSDFNLKNNWDPNNTQPGAVRGFQLIDQNIVKEAKNLAKRKGFMLKTEVFTKCLEVFKQFKDNADYK